MGEIQSTSLYLHCPGKAVTQTPRLGRGTVERLFPVDTGNQFVSDFTEPY